MSVRVALIGASGHGRWHRREIARLQALGRVELVGMCDVRAVEPEPDAPVPDDLPTFLDHRALLRSVQPKIVIICTPPHTHLPIAVDALRAGADILLEKPPVLSMAEHDALDKVAVETGRAVQIGFQALGSAALTELIEAVVAGRLGEVTAVAAVASWQRDDAYYARSPWAGRRRLDGQPSLDGVLANPLAHALMQGIAVAAVVSAPVPVSPVVIEVERYRTRPIEVDDTAFLRVDLHRGPCLLAALTLAGEEHIPGEIIVTGTAGTAVLEYPTDRLRLPADGDWREVPGRTGLLPNLLDHRDDPAAVPLISPLSRTAPFTALLEILYEGPEPAMIGAEHLLSAGEGPSRILTIPGVNAVLRSAAERLSLPSELDAPWSVPPHVIRYCKHSASDGDN